MITSAKYMAITDPAGNKSNDTIKATIAGKEVFVPMDTDNTDYQKVLEWVADGNTIEEAD